MGRAEQRGEVGALQAQLLGGPFDLRRESGKQVL